jgi:hypothetical protein
MKLSVSTFDRKPTKMAIQDANLITSKIDRYDLEQLIHAYTYYREFRTPKGRDNHKRGILSHLVQTGVITKEKALNTRI